MSLRAVALGATVALTGVLIGAVAATNTSTEGKLIGALILGVLVLALGVDPLRAAGLRRGNAPDREPTEGIQTPP